MNGPSAMELCIPRDADLDSFTELPPLRDNCEYTLIFPRLGNSDLCWMLTALETLNNKRSDKKTQLELEGTLSPSAFCFCRKIYFNKNILIVFFM